MAQVVEGGAVRTAPRRRSLPLSYARPEQTRLRRTLIRAVEALSGRAALQRLYDDWQDAATDRDEPIFSAAIRLMRIRPRIVDGDLDALPRTGPVLVLANHPFEIVDGLLAGHLVALRRRDVKIMTHSLLCQPEEARDILLPVDFGPGDAARRTSADTRRRAVEWLGQGHVLIVFPAGSVSTVVRPLARHAVDAGWHPFVARLAMGQGVRTIVMFLHGQNSRAFQIASHLSYPLRVALILRETALRMGGTIPVSLTPPLTADDLPEGGGRAGLASALRRMCYAMAGPGGPDPDREFVWPGYIRW